MLAGIIAQNGREQLSPLDCLLERLIGDRWRFRMRSHSACPDWQGVSVNEMLLELLRDSCVSEKLYGARDDIQRKTPNASAG